jgi:hypothetical protein
VHGKVIVKNYSATQHINLIPFADGTYTVCE